MSIIYFFRPFSTLTGEYISNNNDWKSYMMVDGGDNFEL